MDRLKIILSLMLLLSIQSPVYCSDNLIGLTPSGDGNPGGGKGPIIPVGDGNPGGGKGPIIPVGDGNPGGNGGPLIEEKGGESSGFISRETRRMLGELKISVKNNSVPKVGPVNTRWVKAKDRIKILSSNGNLYKSLLQFFRKHGYSIDIVKQDPAEGLDADAYRVVGVLNRQRSSFHLVRILIIETNQQVLCAVESSLNEVMDVKFYIHTCGGFVEGQPGPRVLEGQRFPKSKTMKGEPKQFDSLIFKRSFPK